MDGTVDDPLLFNVFFEGVKTPNCCCFFRKSLLWDQIQKQLQLKNQMSNPFNLHQLDLCCASQPPSISREQLVLSNSPKNHSPKTIPKKTIPQKTIPLRFWKLRFSPNEKPPTAVSEIHSPTAHRCSDVFWQPQTRRAVETREKGERGRLRGLRAVVGLKSVTFATRR